MRARRGLRRGLRSSVRNPETISASMSFAAVKQGIRIRTELARLAGEKVFRLGWDAPRQLFSHEALILSQKNRKQQPRRGGCGPAKKGKWKKDLAGNPLDDGEGLVGFYTAMGNRPNRNWQGRQDLNLKPPDEQPGALTVELQPRKWRRRRIGLSGSQLRCCRVRKSKPFRYAPKGRAACALAVQ